MNDNICPYCMTVNPSKDHVCKENMTDTYDEEEMPDSEDEDD